MKIIFYESKLDQDMLLKLAGQFIAGNIEISVTRNNDLILNPGTKEVALFLAKIALNQEPFDASVSIASIFYFFSNGAKSTLTWSAQEPPEIFLELQTEFDRLMNLAWFT